MNKLEFQISGNPLSLILQLKPFHDAYLIKTNAINMFHQITEALTLSVYIFRYNRLNVTFRRIMHLAADISRPLLFFE